MALAERSLGPGGIGREIEAAWSHDSSDVVLKTRKQASASVGPRNWRNERSPGQMRVVHVGIGIGVVVVLVECVGVVRKRGFVPSVILMVGSPT